MARIGLLISAMYKLLLVLDARVEPNFFQENQMTSFLKRQVVRLSKTTWAHDGS